MKNCAYKLRSVVSIATNQMESHSIRTLQKKRTSNFREDETKLLIQLWGSPYIQNKLYLTHRKAPVMRLLAANMQQRGFYRTPDEIKTRIRNLKCLYHRIKRSMACGTNVGTIDPDWPHFKAMDAILSKEGIKPKDCKEDTVLEGPRCEDIKQEIDIDINDDMESWNDSVGSEFEEEQNVTPPPPPLKPAPVKSKNEETTQVLIQKPTIKPMPTVMPSFTIPAQNSQNNCVKTGTMPSIPLPLLILNSLQPQQHVQDKKEVSSSTNFYTDKGPGNLNVILKELLDVQKENLDVAKQKLELEKQRLEFDRVVGSQLLTLVPMVGGLLQRMAFNSNIPDSNIDLFKNGRKRSSTTEIDILKDSKILRSVLEQGIRRYMMGDDENEEKDSNNDENSRNDENSNLENK